MSSKSTDLRLLLQREINIHPGFPQMNPKISCTKNTISRIFLKNVFIYPENFLNFSAD